MSRAWPIVTFDVPLDKNTRAVLNCSKFDLSLHEAVELKYAASESGDAQLALSGMPRPLSAGDNLSARYVPPGREVFYLGRVMGGPRYGARGTVRRALGRTAVVDMGRWGTWHIPYCFLSEATQNAA